MYVPAIALLRALILLLLPLGTSSTRAQAPVDKGVPTASLVRVAPLHLPGVVDSNSPVVWSLDEGQPRMRVLTSVDGQPSLSVGRRLWQLSDTTPVAFTSHPGHGVWMEAVIEDAQGVWYGYYHNEIPADMCGRLDRVVPRIGAARSLDKGRTWHDLGIVLEAPLDALRCDSANEYFVGGVGDFSAVLDAEGSHLYMFVSQYSRDPSVQGIAAARLLWAGRDEPVGRVEVWAGGAWLPPVVQQPESASTSGRIRSSSEVPTARAMTWTHATGDALFPTARPWHDDDEQNDAFWGAAVHWNAYLGQYVMLLNRAADEAWTQEGVYVSFSPSLDDPRRWSPPQRLLSGGRWYPQVIGLERGEGTDKRAGQLARFYMSGRSNYLIEFQRP